MSLITTTEQLKEYIPALAGIKEDEANSGFVNFKRDLEIANSFIKTELVGATIYGKLAANGDIKNLLIAVEAYKAAISFIPQNDLVLTESGFAVMSTNNQAPASKERVERLIDTLKDNLAQSIESLQLLIEDNAELRADWQGVKYCSYFPEYICKTNRLFLEYAMDYRGTSLDYVKLKPQLMQARSLLVKKLGTEFHQDLINNPASIANTAVIDDMRLLFTALVMKQDAIAADLTRLLMAYLIKNMVDYPLFAAYYGIPEKWVNDDDSRIIVFGAPRR